VTQRYNWMLIFVVIIVSLLIPLFIKSPYEIDLIIVIFIHAVIAMTFIMLVRTGMINLGIMAFMGIGAYTSAVLVTKLGLSFWLSLSVSTLITALIALIVGYILIGSGSSGFGFVILSSVIGMLFSVAVGNISYLGGYAGISNISPPSPIQLPFLPAITFSVVNKVPFYYLAWFLLVIIVIIIKAFYSSWIGRAWAAIGLNPQLAGSIGINIFRYKMLVFMVASAIAGVMGCYYAHYISFVSPNLYDMWSNIYIQMYAILGGMGYAVLGPLIGAGVMTLLPELLRKAVEIAPVIYGVILVILILFLPSGILGQIDSIRGYFRQSSSVVKGTVPSSLLDKWKIWKK
jgi:branched-chain amino acid transport system permease protein